MSIAMNVYVIASREKLWYYKNSHFLFFPDIPAAVSLPHFLNADPSLLEEVDGLHPDKEKHETYVILQQVSVN